MSIISKDCYIHNQKYSDQFYSNLNKIREKNSFDDSIYEIIKKRYCRCYQVVRSEPNMT